MQVLEGTRADAAWIHECRLRKPATSVKVAAKGTGNTKMHHAFATFYK